MKPDEIGGVEHIDFYRDLRVRIHSWAKGNRHLGKDHPPGLV